MDDEAVLARPAKQPCCFSANNAIVPPIFLRYTHGLVMMISLDDHLESLERLQHDASLKRVWPQVVETAGKWLRPDGRFKVLQCEHLSGAEIKSRYKPAEVEPTEILRLKDMDRYISALVLFESTTYYRYGCVKGVFNLDGGEVVLRRNEVFSQATLEGLNFWHATAESRWASREEMMADLAERIRMIIAAGEDWHRKRGSVEDPIGAVRTRELLKGLEAELPTKDLVLLLGMFEGCMMGYSNEVLGLEEQGLLPPDFAARTYDLVKRLRFGGVVSSQGLRKWWPSQSSAR